MLFAEVTLTDWLGAAAIILGALVLIWIIRRTLRELANKSVMQHNVAELSMQISVVIVVILAALYSMSLLDVEIGPLLGALGISGVILGISLQPVLGNFIGSVLLHGSQPVRIGDQIHSSGVDGTVIDITNREVEILTFDGVAVHLPNLKVLEQPLTNYTHDDDRRTNHDEPSRPRPNYFHDDDPRTNHDRSNSSRHLNHHDSARGDHRSNDNSETNAYGKTDHNHRTSNDHYCGTSNDHNHHSCALSESGARPTNHAVLHGLQRGRVSCYRRQRVGGVDG